MCLALYFISRVTHSQSGAPKSVCLRWVLGENNGARGHYSQLGINTSIAHKASVCILLSVPTSATMVNTTNASQQFLK